MTVVNTNRHYLTYLYSMGYLVKVTDDSYYIYEFCRKRRDGFFAKTSHTPLTPLKGRSKGAEVEARDYGACDAEV